MRIVVQLLFLLAVVRLALPPAFAQKPVRVVIRVDDIQSRNTTTVPRSVLPFQQVVEARGGRVTWVTIPHRLIESQNTDGVLARELRLSAAAGHEIAQHGYNHICQRCSSSGHEMWCATNSTTFSTAQQQLLVRDGKRILMDSIGVTPKSFVSPGHYEDTTTYSVISAEGYQYISTTQRSTGPVSSTLFNLASGPDYTWQLTSQTYSTKLNQAIADVRMVENTTGVFLILFHDPFIRPGYENGLVVRWTAELLDSLAASFGQRLRILTLSQTIEELRGVTAAQFITPSGPAPSLQLSSYPNPFNASTIIRVVPNSTDPMLVSIVNLAGQVTRQYFELPLLAGTPIDIRFDGASLSTGVYVVRAQQNGHAATHKILLLK